MSDSNDPFVAALHALVPTIVPGASRIAGLRRLSAGATLETWSFDATGDTASDTGEPRPLRHPLILRRSPGGLRSSESVPLAVEAELIRRLAGSGAPVATVVHTLVPDDSLGDGFLMTRIEGETIPRKILRDPVHAEVRPRLVDQFGSILAAIHRCDPQALPLLPSKPPSAVIARLRARQDAMARPSPFFEMALQWLNAHEPEPLARLRLVHGDFRNGNLIIGPEGVRAVLDWEVAHLGDPMADLAWLCLPPWRFGRNELAVGGLGTREALFAAYESAGGERVDPERVRFWEALGSLRWWMGCAGMLEWFSSGRDRSVERAMIARRVSESELDFLRLMAGRN
ncbi:MAG: phosphotransferase family protein [Burkholderiales bacterium]|nr:phosphotransferase family protein [Burkholderiales bacterium]